MTAIVLAWTVFNLGFGQPVGQALRGRPISPHHHLVNLDNSQINESSGLAASINFADQFYTHNDSGDGPRFFRFNRAGYVQAIYTLAGVTAKDWEDMSSARIKGVNYLYLGDIGDNNSNRSSIFIYRVVEPTTSTGPTISSFQTYTLTYPDGARNCEILFVDPKSGDIYLVSKVKSGSSKVYRLPAPSGSGNFTLNYLGQITVGDSFPGSQSFTGGDASAEGQHVVLRTYWGAYEYDVKGVFQDWWKQTPRQLKLMLEPQGESICYARNGAWVYTTSEGAPCPLNGMQLAIDEASK